MNYLLEINKDPLQYIHQHVAHRFPNEAFGFLYGIEDADGRRVVLLAEAINNNRFGWTDLLYTAADKAKHLGLKLLGIYQSTTDDSKAFSKLEQKEAIPDFSYLNLFVTNAKIEGLNSKQFNQNSKSFEEEPLIIDQTEIMERELV